MAFGTKSSFGGKPKKAAAFGTANRKPQMNASSKSAEEESDIELTDLQKSFRCRRDQEQARFIDAVDSEYWTCFCFQNREQKEAFLKALKIIHLGDKYLNGMAVADVLKIPLPMNFSPVRDVKPDIKLAEMAME